ncbi:hypothetical protein NUBL22010_20370 [Klebsiella pneumoniae]|nr:hypothetical protein NUBL22010_20370 [Klebsiella pneumoniae]
MTAIKVTTTIQQAARIPTVCVGVRLPSAQVWVLSAPNKKVESGTQILAAVLTIHTTYEANHIKVPMKAKRGPTLWFIQE